MSELTNDTYKLAKQIYKEYLGSKKSNSSDAKHFPVAENVDDISDYLDELEDAEYIETFSDYSFEITPAFISFMENRLKNTVIGATDMIAKFIP